MKRPALGTKLQRRRQALGLSQLKLALDAGVSPRHLAFIETGRTRPSREMVLRLVERLRVPLRERNAYLLAAGFAPAFEQHELAAPALAAVKAAAAAVLATHMPFPAIVLDRRRDIVMANPAAEALCAGVAPALLAAPNIYRVLLHPDGLASRIVNFGEYSHHLIERLRGDAETSNDPALFELLAEVQAYPRVGATASGDAVLVLRLRGAGNFITALATFGTPFDVTAAELVLESLFPADDATRRAYL